MTQTIVNAPAVLPEQAIEVVVAATRLHDSLYHDAAAMKAVLDVAPRGFMEAFLALQSAILRGRR